MKNDFERITCKSDSFICKYFNPDDINDIVKLQETVSENLQEAGTPRHIVKRSREHFLKHLCEPHAMFGVTTHQGIIIAQSIFRISDVSTDEELCIKKLPEFKEGKNKLSVIQGMIVHPDFEGRGLMPLMLGQWFKWCDEKEIHHLAARTQSNHNVSSKGFLKRGFNKVAVIIDPQDDAEVNVLHKNTLEL